MKRYLKYLKNKFVIAGTILFGWLIFFDGNNLIYRYNAEGKLNKLQQDKAYYEQRIDEMEGKQQKLEEDQDALERFARENYLMKRPDEEVFIVVDE